MKSSKQYRYSNLLITTYFIIIIFSLGKILGATGQTLFNVHHALNYISKFINITSMINFSSVFAASCTLFIVSITRAPAIHRQFHSKVYPDLYIHISNLYRRSFYHFLVVTNIMAGIFSSVGAYLGSITLIEFVANAMGHLLVNPWERVLSQAIALFFALSSFAAFYSFNIYKAKINSAKLANMSKTSSKVFFNKIALKTLFISLLNVMSLPFISYFLTKHALHKMCLLEYFSYSIIQYIAIFSAITALISSLTTTVAAMYEYFSEKRIATQNESTFLASFRYVTYMTGIVDSSASGLGTFIGVVTVSNDFFCATNAYVIFLAIGSALSSALLIFAFSVRQGWNDVIHYLRNKKMVSLT